MIAITETKIKKCIEPAFNPSLKGYKFDHTPTESECGGTTVYIAVYLTSKNRPDLETLFYKPKELESTFIEIINPTRKNIVCGCIYRHPSISFLCPLLEKLVSENKNIFLLGDFNIDLIKIDSESEIANFFDTIASNLLVPREFVIN